MAREAVDAASAAISGEERFNGLFAVDADRRRAGPSGAAGGYEKLQAAKRRHWARPKRHRYCHFGST
ncbi:hypothetical protein M8494_16460 [Serratia ureilytica]